jgi:zona occludens toxin (predicted ATPase)
MFSFLFLAFWAIVIFLVAFFAGRLYFKEPGRAQVFGLALAAMFFVTYNLHDDAATVGPTVAPSSAAATPVAEAAAIAAIGHSAGATCSASVPAQSMPPGTGSLDVLRAGPATIASGAAVPANEAIDFGGWAIDIQGHVLARAVCLTIDGKSDASVHVTYGVVREDVGTALHDPALAPSGFGLEIPAHALSPGKHVLQVIVASGASTWARLGPPVLIRST